MSRRPIATVTVIHRPDFGRQAVRVEVACPSGVTAVSSVPGRATPEVRVPVLIAAACSEHEARCGECDLADAYHHADVLLRATTEDAWRAVWDERHQRRVVAGQAL